MAKAKGGKKAKKKTGKTRKVPVRAAARAAKGKKKVVRKKAAKALPRRKKAAPVKKKKVVRKKPVARKAAAPRAKKAPAARPKPARQPVTRTPAPDYVARRAAVPEAPAPTPPPAPPARPAPAPAVREPTVARVAVPPSDYQPSGAELSSVRHLLKQLAEDLINGMTITESDATPLLGSFVSDGPTPMEVWLLWRSFEANTDQFTGGAARDVRRLLNALGVPGH